MQQGKWPKVTAPLTEEQRRINDDFVRYWHEVLPQKFGLVERFNHGYSVRHAPPTFRRTLEIGAGLGEHLAFERLTPEQEAGYYSLELRENMVTKIRERFPRVHAVLGDCQQRLDFPDGFFDRIIAVHVLEHLPDLPATIREMHRLCDKRHGVFSIVIPCEGGWAYGLARRVSAQRIFEKRYKQSYDWFIRREHINLPAEILAELKPYFHLGPATYFPLHVPSVRLNLCVGLTLKPKEGN